MNFANKKVLIFGLGRLGGGVATALWLAKHKAEIRITDLLSQQALQASFRPLARLKDSKIKYILGHHRQQDINWADVIVVNPGVSYKHPLIQSARKKNKTIVNAGSLFFQAAQADVIAITGTRGKTTTTTWTHHLIKNFYPKTILGGNQPDKALLKIISKTRKNNCAIVELSSFQLEFYERALKAPKIALITNIYPDHLNRYQSLKEYALMKAKIFQNQSQNEYLILNHDNDWTMFFLSLQPKSQIYFFSLKPLSKNLNGLFVKNNYIYLQINSDLKKFFSIKKFRQQWGEHNLCNLLASLTAAFLYYYSSGAPRHSLKYFRDRSLTAAINKFKKLLSSLPQIKLRQEIIYKNKNLTVINDSAATAPEAVSQALRRFKSKHLILLTGGTDKNLDFKNLALEVKKTLSPRNIIFLRGSATRKLLKELKTIGFRYLEENICGNLKDCVSAALLACRSQSKASGIILFSPGAASFEKFKNEFDRGEQFNQLIKSLKESGINSGRS